MAACRSATVASVGSPVGAISGRGVRTGLPSVRDAAAPASALNWRKFLRLNSCDVLCAGVGVDRARFKSSSTLRRMAEAFSPGDMASSSRPVRWKRRGYLCCRGTRAHLIRVAGGAGLEIPRRQSGVKYRRFESKSNVRVRYRTRVPVAPCHGRPVLAILAGPIRCLLLGLDRLEQLDESRGQIAVLVIAVACRSRHSDGEAADPPGCGKVARPKSELVAELPIYLGVTDKAHAVTAVADRADAIGAGYAQALPRIVVDEVAVLLGLLLVHKGHVVVLLILALPLVFYFLLPWDTGTAACGDQSGRCLQAVGEVGHADTE